MRDTFNFDPEAGDKLGCPKCHASGVVEKILRGVIYMAWKKPGEGMSKSEYPWSRKVPCAFCGQAAIEDRRGG